MFMFTAFHWLKRKSKWNKHVFLLVIIPELGHVNISHEDWDQEALLNADQFLYDQSYYCQSEPGFVRPTKILKLLAEIIYLRKWRK